jgi:pimeloyl-ACP methyl ester carboxylesterase
LHGLGGDGSRWTATAAALAGAHRVIALDQIGFGQSDKPLVNYNHGLLAEFLAEFINVAGIGKASLVGHSMGAFVAMRVAVDHPEMVERLVLVDGGGVGPNVPRDRRLVQIQNSTTLAETREYFELMFHDASRVTDQMVRDNYQRRLQASYTISRMQEARANNVGIISEEEAARIAAPTLILWGKQDRLLEPAMAGTLDRLIPDSRVVLIDACGHIPQVEQADHFNELVRKFLAESKR